ncbi:MAG TPA: hypothetical protein PK414_11180 [Anaerolineales bacterium]|nr:hypothetical protein [Anaerolineales bacterium]
MDTLYFLYGNIYLIWNPEVLLQAGFPKVDLSETSSILELSQEA